MEKNVLKDKVKGGWAGQTIGCLYGSETEFRYRERMIPDSLAIPHKDSIAVWWFNNAPGLFDDVYMDLTFVEVFEKEGLDAPVSSFANAYANAPYYLWHANLQGRYNVLQGMSSPESGYWENNPHADDIDFQIEADYAGLMSPGMPRCAAYYSDGIGHIMNYGDGWYGGVYMATMYSLAFVSDDVNYIVNEALKAIPEGSNYYRCMSEVIAWHKEHPEDWKSAWYMCEERINHDKGCPSCVMHELNIDATINSAYVLIGLLYGEGDFEKTMDIATRCGQDSDCNPASAAGILGTMLGYSSIPEKYREWLNPVENIPFGNNCSDYSLNMTYDISYGHALQVIERNGGKINEETVCIRVQKPTAVRFEQSFEGISLANAEDVNLKLREDAVIEFDGVGIVVQDYFTGTAPEGYVALVECSFDGGEPEVRNIPLNVLSFPDNIIHTYKLEDGHHILSLKWTNPIESVELGVNRIITYIPEDE